jgi:hypothetical protein
MLRSDRDNVCACVNKTGRFGRKRNEKTENSHMNAMNGDGKWRLDSDSYLIASIFSTAIDRE